MPFWIGTPTDDSLVGSRSVFPLGRWCVADFLTLLVVAKTISNN